METLTTSITINRPVEIIFNWFTNFANHIQWQPNLVESEITSRGPLGVGTTYRYVSKAMGCKFSSVGEITAYELNRIWGQKNCDGPAPVEIIYEFEPGKNGTTITVTIKSAIGSFPNAGSFVREQLIKSVQEQNLRLKKILEKEKKLDTTFE